MTVLNDSKYLQKRLTKDEEVPPGRIRLAQSLVALLEEKEFSAISAAEIAKHAGVTDALIYKYYKDKRGLLHHVLSEYLLQFHQQLRMALKGIKGSLNQLRKLIWTHIHVYANNRVFAKILLLEVRNYPDYYKSETYELVRIYSDVVLEILEEGISEGEIRGDIPPKFLRQCILGSIEHVCLTGIVFNREISPDLLTEDLCEIIFNGIDVSKV
ncbi:MAG: TetR/AcrR family transcriptional regulator [Deltaproteobacteria bacterium]|nr:TetR/AcrR family transcriptional regulator [Deltaproteobacteria bacterium]MBW2180278.1 TetR/AcrR family transcriptional regulator [Deltaproteobacteria bacterium]